MKIVYITNIPSPYQIKWAEQLRKKYEVEFWFMTDIAHSKSLRPNYWNTELPSYCKMMPSWFKQKELCYGPTLTAELKKFNPDIVMLGGGCLMISFMQGYRWAVKNHKPIIAGPLEFGQKMYAISKIIRNIIMYRILYRKVTLWLANAYIHFDYLQMVLKTKKNVLFQNRDDYEPYLKHPVRATNKVISFMYGGAIARRLRVPELLNVFENLAKNYSDVKLVIGGYGPEKEKCKLRVSTSSYLTDKVQFYDVTSWDEIPDVYESCHVLINFAEYSPGSGVILSAIASGMGIISNITVNATRHFVIDNYNGFIVSDEHSLYKAMEQYVLQPELVVQHSKRSKDIGISTLTMEQHLDDFSSIIQANIELHVVSGQEEEAIYERA